MFNQPQFDILEPSLSFCEAAHGFLLAWLRVR
jgi:hypothetical protein